jgi:hypothetical protein
MYILVQQLHLCRRTEALSGFSCCCIIACEQIIPAFFGDAPPLLSDCALATSTSDGNDVTISAITPNKAMIWTMNFGQSGGVVVILLLVFMQENILKIQGTL